MLRLILLFGFTSSFCLAETVVPTRTIRAATVITYDAVAQTNESTPGAYANIEEVIGQEARIALYPGRPIRLGNVVPAAIIERNELVTLVFSQGGLTITSEGRALARARAGDSLRVLSLSTRTSVFGRVQSDGSVLVSK